MKPTVWLPEIAWDANKYTRGSLLVIAGSKRYPGAAILAAMAAERTGAGYVTLATPVPAAAVAQTRLLSIPVIATEATRAPKSPEGTFIATALTQIIDELRQIDAIACGPGLQACADTTGLVASLLALSALRDIPLVLDADALNVLPDAWMPIEKGATPLILTPHAGELKRLLRAFAVSDAGELAALLKAVIVSKGPTTEIIRPAGETWYDWILQLQQLQPQTFQTTQPPQTPQTEDRGDTCDQNSQTTQPPQTPQTEDRGDTQGQSSQTSQTKISLSPGTPALAKAGTGDVLCGIIGSLLAQGMSAWDAAELGVYLHGDAGKIAAARYGTRAVIAEDIIQAIPEALMLYENAQIKGGAQC